VDQGRAALSVLPEPVSPAWLRLPSPGIRYMAYGAFWFSLMSLLVKTAGQRLPSSEIVLARAIVSLVLSYALLRQARVPIWGNDPKLLTLRGLLGAAALACFYYALVHLPLAEATVIQYTNPVFTALLAAWLLRERLGVREGACVAASLGGVLLIARPGFLFGAEHAIDPVTVGIALLGALLSAGAYVTIRRLARTEHPLVIVFYFPLVTVPATIPLVVPVAVWPRGWEWLLLLGVGVTTQIAQVYMTRGLQLLPAARATTVGYTQIVFAALWGALFFAEIPDRWSFAGAALIIASTLALATRGGEAEQAAAVAAVTPERSISEPPEPGRRQP
jgi:drug/metabolite transporter (DMT)-like permease